MNRQISKLTAIAMILILLAAAFCGGTANAEGDIGTVKRLGGATRIETAVEISNEGWGSEGASSVVIANGYSYPDAMAGVPLARLLNAPILLTEGTAPEAELISQLNNLSCKNIYILGGESCVSSEFFNALISSGYCVERIFGSDRFATCTAIAEKMAELGASADCIFIASGTNFPDALSASPAAGALGIPILYSDKLGNLSGDTLQLISASDINHAIILGGESAVPSNAESILKAAGIEDVQRIFGADRYQTSLAVNRYFSSVLSGSDIFLASGEDFPDALSGGAFAAKAGSPVILLSNSINIPGAYEFFLERSSKTVYVLGLENALSDYAVNTFLSGGTITTTTTITTTIATTTKPTQNSGGKKAYLTFDDGPSANTAKILDILDRYNVKATFFVIYREGYENTYKEIVRRGHTIALHSYTHNYAKIYSSKTAYFNDLNKLSNYIEKLTGVQSKILRFPGGGSNTISRNYNKGIMTVLTREVQSRGYRYYDWNVDSGDANINKNANAATIVSNVKKGCGSLKNAVILMHDAPSKAATVAALPQIIEYLQSKGYEILPITEGTPEVHHAVVN